LPKDYISQKRIVLQGFSVVPTPYGEKKCIYFGYDRDDAYVFLYNGRKVAVDLIEFKLVQKNSSWNWEPLLVFIDDDFDGYANRLFIDREIKGVLEKVYDITEKKVVMDEKIFQEISPWKRMEAPVN
jgi:hypothetical protein